MTDPKAALTLQKFAVEELKWETESIFTLVLVPDEGEVFEFLPGQWAYLHLLNEDGTTWRAPFSIATAPEESKNKVEFSIKIRGDFTKRASRLIPGDRVAVQGPFGVFFLHEDVSPLVMFAAGIGIMPFRSMIRSLALRKAGTEVYLFYSGKSVEGMAYFPELKKIALEWTAFHPVFTLTESAPPKWEGEIGRINAEMVKKYYHAFDQGEFLMCGPEHFMEDVESMLKAQSVDTKKRLRRELFG